MAGNDPFRGIKLSEQATTPGVEQRLFAAPSISTTPEPQKPVENPAPAPKAPTPGPEQPNPAADPKRRLRPASVASSTFNLDDEALYKASYVFTIQELEALEDLKLELRRELDSKVTKNDLIRTALHMLVEDYREKSSDSYVHRKISRRRHSP
jgi:hypothetical protein